MKNPYEVLEVTPSASDEVIRMAYKALARKYHPDTYSGDKSYANDRMAEINEAYAILSDPIKRTEFDQTCHTKSEKTDDSEYRATGPKYQQESPPPPPPVWSPPPPPATPKSGCLSSIFHGLWKLAKFIIVLFFVYFILSGKLFDLFKTPANKTEIRQSSPVVTPYIPDTDSTDEDKAEFIVYSYLESLQKLDVETAKSFVSGERLVGLTNALVEAYSADADPNDLTASMVKTIRNFKYVVDSAVYRANTTESTVDVLLEVRNLYTVMNIATQRYSELMENEDWINSYIINAAISGKEADELSVYRECIDKALTESSDTIKYTVRFTLQSADSSWKIIAIDDDVEFVNVLYGHLADYIEDMGVGFEIPRG